MLHFIIFSGFNERAVIAFLRVLQQYEVSYSIIASGKNDNIFETVYAKNVAYCRDDLSLEPNRLIDILTCVCNDGLNNQYIIAPSTEALNRVFLSYKQLISNRGIILPLVDEDLYKLISDKISFNNLCKNNGIDVPKEYQVFDDAKIPFVAKPKTYGNGKFLKPILVRSNEDKQVFKISNDESDYFYQELVEGRSFYLLMYISKNREVNVFSQENFIQQPEGRSIIAARASDLHNLCIKDVFVDMLIRTNFFGFIMIELRQSGDKYYMIEANPRFWGPSQLFVDAMRYNLFESFLEDYGIKVNILKTKKNNLDARYYWHEGMIQSKENFSSLMFYSISYDEYVRELDKWIAVDIYKKEDTLELFKKIL